MKNIDFDDIYARSAIVVQAACMYPEAFIGGGIFVENMTAYSSVPKIVPFVTSIIYTTGPGHLIINNSKFSSYFEFPSSGALLFIIGSEI